MNNRTNKNSQAWPLEINLENDGSRLVVKFDDGNTYQYSAELLRVESPSAEVQGHSLGEKKLVRGKADVKIIDIKPVGNYAIQLYFDDGHDSGIYPYYTLVKFGKEYDEIWRNYQNSIKNAN